MSDTIKVTITVPALLRHAVELAKKRDGEDVWERQARTLYELGYQIAPITGTATSGDPIPSPGMVVDGDMLRDLIADAVPGFFTDSVAHQLASDVLDAAVKSGMTVLHGPDYQLRTTAQPGAGTASGDGAR